MLGMAVVAMLSLGLGYALFDAFEEGRSDADDDEEHLEPMPIGPIPEPDPDPPEPGPEEPGPDYPGEPPPDGEPNGGPFVVGDGETLVGTEGGDLITSEPARTVFSIDIRGAGGADEIDMALGQSTVSGGDGDLWMFGGELKVSGDDGDDAITMLGGDGSTVWGGRGDDRIEVDGFQTSINGGAGDDAIFGGGGTTIEGGDGNDHLVALNLAGGQVDGSSGNDTLDLSTRPFDQSSTAQGEAGDDTLRVQVPLVLSDEASFLYLYGGDGADTFVASIEADPTRDDDPPPLIDGGVIMTIQDFEPGEDVLVVDPDGLIAGVNELCLLSAELVEAHDGSHTDLVLTYETQLGGVAQQGTVRLLGVTGLTMDDVVFASVRDLADLPV